ncbi:MAG: putative addiction module antidote protein [Proteobacteria bacterium]|nr:putative addiction module antidote protein [Pseudomonadota bacterium]
MTPIQTRPYDAARYLRDDADGTAYLQAVIDSAQGDDRLILAALEEVARAHNMSQLARDAGMTRAGLYKALSGTGRPSFATVARILHALGLQVSAKPLAGAVR